MEPYRPNCYKIPELNGLRVLLVFIVSWYHFWQQSWLTPSIGSYSLDYLLRGALVQAGIDLHIKLFCGLLVAIWLIINELISILENLAAIGVPGFPRLSKLLKRLKNTVSEEEEEK